MLLLNENLCDPRVCENVPLSLHNFTRTSTYQYTSGLYKTSMSGSSRGVSTDALSDVSSSSFFSAVSLASSATASWASAASAASTRSADSPRIMCIEAEGVIVTGGKVMQICVVCKEATTFNKKRSNNLFKLGQRGGILLALCNDCHAVHGVRAIPNRDKHSFKLQCDTCSRYVLTHNSHEAKFAWLRGRFSCSLCALAVPSAEAPVDKAVASNVDEADLESLLRRRATRTIQRAARQWKGRTRQCLSFPPGLGPPPTTATQPPAATPPTTPAAPPTPPATPPVPPALPTAAEASAVSRLQKAARARLARRRAAPIWTAAQRLLVAQKALAEKDAVLTKTEKELSDERGQHAATYQENCCNWERCQSLCRDLYSWQLHAQNLQCQLDDTDLQMRAGMSRVRQLEAEARCVREAVTSAHEHAAIRRSWPYRCQFPALNVKDR